MAKFSKYIFGGILGAGLAVLFTPKKGADMRRLLMSSRHPAQLPSGPEPTAVTEPTSAPEPTVPEPTVAPAAVAVPEPAAAPEPVPADLDARIEETRRQVEVELGSPVAESTAAGPAAIEAPESIEAVEAAAEAAPVPFDESAEAELTSYAEPDTEIEIEETAEPEFDAPAAEAAPADAYSFLDEAEAEEPEAAVEAEPAAAVEAAPGIDMADEEETSSWEDDEWITGEEQAEVEAVAPPAPEAETDIETDMAERLGEAIAAAEATGNDTVAEVETDAGGLDEYEAEESVEVIEDLPAVPEEADDTDSMSYLSTPAEGEPEVEGATEVEPPAPEPAAPQPAVPGKPEFDREAMRRRIEETRARLKAKAFDAMVSGESFISTEQETDNEGSGVDLDSESQKAIEQSLREED